MKKKYYTHKVLLSSVCLGIGLKWEFAKFAKVVSDMFVWNCSDNCVNETWHWLEIENSSSSRDWQHINLVCMSTEQHVAERVTEVALRKFARVLLLKSGE